MRPSTAPLQPAALDRAAALLATDPGQAARLAEALLSSAPNDPRLLLILASARRRGGDARGACAILEPLARSFPNAALTQYELGAALLALGRTRPATAALRKAVTLNRDLQDAWRLLGDLLFEAGDAAGSSQAYAEHGRASVRDPLLKPAAEALAQNRFEAAEPLLRAHLKAHPNDAPALRMLADALLRQGGYTDAEVLLEHALKLDPASDGARFSYATALFRQQKAAQALPHVERLLAADAQEPAYRNLMAACLGLVGEYARANALYEALLERYGRQPSIWLNYGHSLRVVGRRDDAVAAYRRCIALDPGLGDAWWSLANLKVAAFTADDVQAMGRQLKRADLPAEERLHLHYALGKALEDRGEYGGSFESYALGAQMRRTSAGYDAAETTRQTRASMAVFTPAFFEARRGWGAMNDEPIFIVGLPRSGSTLIEQILASHSQVEGTMELPDIGIIARGLGFQGGEAYPQSLARLGAAEVRALGELYIERTRIHRKLGRRLFIDKMPNNFQHIGLIRTILPKARIIDARRHPLGAGFSAFKQHFAQGQSFSYGLEDIGRYYRDYVALMDHFDAVQPGHVHRAIYEDVVEDTEGQVRRLLDACGLPFEESCLRFYENGRAVMTVSSEQVRRPIFRDGLEQWRRYEPWLEPLKQALGPALAGWRGQWNHE